MPAYGKDIIRNFALWVDGRAYAGNVEMCKLPTLELKTEEFRAGGMDAPIDIPMGMNKLECSFTLNQFSKDVLNLWGVTTGQTTPLVLRGSAESEFGLKQPVEVRLEGKLIKVDPSEFKAGEAVKLEVMVNVHRYELKVSGQTVHLIDIPNFVRIINGFDQLAVTRLNLGI
ncbi:MAG: phage major tail tube protein [Vampirovibrio sp.]